MGRNLIINPSFENSETLLDPWQTSGVVTLDTTSADPFEGSNVVDLGPLVAPGDLAILSQIFQVPVDGFGRNHLHISYSMLGSATNAQLTVQVQYFGSANAGLPLLRTETVFVKEELTLDAVEGWQTAVVAATHKPPGTVWARIRFILEGLPGALTSISIDNVVVTQE